MPVKDLFFVCLSLVSLMDANLIGFQSWVFWEPQNTLVDILKARILVVWFKPFTPQGEARSWGVFSQLYGTISREFIVRTCFSLSYLFILMWVFSHSSDV